MRHGVRRDGQRLPFRCSPPIFCDGLVRQRLGEPAKSTEPPLSFVFNRSETGFWPAFDDAPALAAS